jgi:hypothetical protein
VPGVGYTLVPERIQPGVLDLVLCVYVKVTRHGPSPDPPWAVVSNPPWACLRIRHTRLRPVPPWQLQQLGRPVWRIRHTTPHGPPWLADLGLRRWYTYLVYPQHRDFAYFVNRRAYLDPPSYPLLGRFACFLDAVNQIVNDVLLGGSFVRAK